jgi:hypothetical protein
VGGGTQTTGGGAKVEVSEEGPDATTMVEEASLSSATTPVGAVVPAGRRRGCVRRYGRGRGPFMVAVREVRNSAKKNAAIAHT